jgi:hypothetical protein
VYGRDILFQFDEVDNGLWGLNIVSHKDIVYVAFGLV